MFLFDVVRPPRYQSSIIKNYSKISLYSGFKRPNGLYSKRTDMSAKRGKCSKPVLQITLADNFLGKLICYSNSGENTSK